MLRFYTLQGVSEGHLPPVFDVCNTSVNLSRELAPTCCSPNVASGEQGKSRAEKQET